MLPVSFSNNLFSLLLFYLKKGGKTKVGNLSIQNFQLTVAIQKESLMAVLYRHGFRNVSWSCENIASIFPFVSPSEIRTILEAKRILKSPASVCWEYPWHESLIGEKKRIISLFGRKGLALASFLCSNYIDTLVLSISGKYIDVPSSLHVDKSKTHQLFKCFPHCVLFSFVKQWCSVPTGPRCLLCSRHFD